MTRKDYTLIARAIRESRINGVGALDAPSKHAIVRRLCLVLESDNPKFDAELFVNACGLPFDSTFNVKV